jgi:hypothetical protein
MINGASINKMVGVSLTFTIISKVKQADAIPFGYSIGYLPGGDPCRCPQMALGFCL